MMQLISILVALATVKLATALPSAVKDANDFVARDADDVNKIWNRPLGARLCTEVNFGGLCQNFTGTYGTFPNCGTF